jgi:hypothetical protein
MGEGVVRGTFTETAAGMVQGDKYVPLFEALKEEQDDLSNIIRAELES